MKRLLVAGAMTFIISVGGSGPALAGGSPLEPRAVDGVGGGTDTWDAWAAPGAVVTMAGDFCDGQGAAPGASAWTAYLAPLAASARRIEVAPVTVSPAAGNGCAYLATTTFTVPDIAPGLYWVDVCADRSCSSFPGDLMGGMLTVAATSLEAELLRERDEQEAAIEGLRRDRTHLRTDVARLEDAISEVQTRFRAAVAEVEQLVDAAEISADVQARREAELTAATALAGRWRAIALGLGLALLLVLAGTTGFAIRRGRDGRISVPDSPAALFEDARLR